MERLTTPVVRDYPSCIDQWSRLLGENPLTYLSDKLSTGHAFTESDSGCKGSLRAHLVNGDTPSPSKVATALLSTAEVVHVPFTTVGEGRSTHQGTRPLARYTFYALMSDVDVVSSIINHATEIYLRYHITAERLRILVVSTPPSLSLTPSLATTTWEECPSIPTHHVNSDGHLILEEKAIVSSGHCYCIDLPLSVLEKPLLFETKTKGRYLEISKQYDDTLGE